MANIIDNLNILNTNLDNAKFKLAKNLKDKGVQALPSDKLDVLADKIVDIPSGSCNLQELNVTTNGVYTPQAGDVRGYNKVTVNVPQGDMYGFNTIGYDGSETAISDGIKYAKQIEDTWDATQTDMTNKFLNDNKLLFLPKKLDVSKIINGYSMFDGTAPVFIENLSFDSLTDATFMFDKCHCKQFKNLNFPKIEKCNQMFQNASGNFENITMNINTSNDDTKLFASNGIERIKNINLVQNSNSVFSLDVFENAYSLKEITGFIKIVLSNHLFYGCRELVSTPIINIDDYIARGYENWFHECGKLTKIIFEGNPASIDKWEQSDFVSVANVGELIYDIRYDYSDVLNKINANSGKKWTSKPNIEITNCKQLSITADDVIGNATTTIIHYTAVVDGRNVITNELVNDYTITADSISEPFAKNETDSPIQITVSFDFYGKTATTTITQGAYVKPQIAVDLNAQWEKVEDVPNPEPQTYDGVYASFSNKGVYDSTALMKINFTAVKKAEVLLRNGGNYASEIFVGNLDDEAPTKDNNQFKIKTYNQSGTTLNDYTKYVIELPDYSPHFVYIGYYKGYGVHTAPDCAYALIKNHPLE